MSIAAYIDGANLHRGISQLGWKLDYSRFRIWLKEKFNVDKAYLFLGLIPSYARLYKELQEAGYILVFKETVRDSTGKVKGNCDAELVLKAISDWYEKKHTNSLLVSGDGDFRCLVDFLREKESIVRILAPKANRCSILLKRSKIKITYLEDFKNNLAIRNKKAPDTDKPV